MGCGGIQPRETDCVGRAWCGRGLRDRHPSTTRPTASSLPLGARAPGRQGGASTPSRSHSPRTSSARLVDRTAPGATRPWRRQRATASRPLAGPRPARTLTHAPRDTSSCTSDGPLISCRDRAPAAVTVAREPTAASSQPKGCAPTPLRDGGGHRLASWTSGYATARSEAVCRGAGCGRTRTSGSVGGQGQQRPWSTRPLITDKLRSYSAACRTVMPSVLHCTDQYANNRAEGSHQPTRQRERQMRRFKSAAHAQRFLSVHGLVLNLFRVGRHLLRSAHHRVLRMRAFAEWDAVTCAC